MYIQKEFDLRDGEIIQIEKRYPGNYGAPGVKRGKKRKRTPEEIARQNETNRWKKVQRLILANFAEGDWHLILKYPASKKPAYQEGIKQIRKFLDEMRKVYKKAGFAFKYIVVTERGKKGQTVHHHLVIEDISQDGLSTTKLVKKLWPYGRMEFVSLYEDGEYEKLAAYIVKKETKEEAEWGTYSRSRNLVVPQPVKKVIHRRTWSRIPKPKAGYYIVKESVYNGINPVTGYPYQHYTMRRTRQQGWKGKGWKGGGWKCRR